MTDSIVDTLSKVIERLQNEKDELADKNKDLEGRLFVLEKTFGLLDNPTLLEHGRQDNAEYLISMKSHSVRVMAEMMVGMLTHEEPTETTPGKYFNYVTVDVSHPVIGELELMLTRKNGKTVADLKRLAWSHLAGLVARVEGFHTAYCIKSTDIDDKYDSLMYEVDKVRQLFKDNPTKLDDLDTI